MWPTLRGQGLGCFLGLQAMGIVAWPRITRDLPMRRPVPRELPSTNQLSSSLHYVMHHILKKSIKGQLTSQACIPAAGIQYGLQFLTTSNQKKLQIKNCSYSKFYLLGLATITDRHYHLSVSFFMFFWSTSFLIWSESDHSVMNTPENKKNSSSAFNFTKCSSGQTGTQCVGMVYCTRVHQRCLALLGSEPTTSWLSGEHSNH